MYPHGPRDVSGIDALRRRTSFSAHPGEAPLPASSILLLDADPAAAEIDLGRPDRRRLHGHADRGPGRRVPQGRGPPARHHRRRRRLEAGRRALRARSGRRPPWPAIPVLCISQTDDVDERIRFLESGADDVMAKPFDARELEARVEALLLRFQRSKDMMPVVSADGLTVAPGAADRRGLQPQGRRRDDDHRHEHRVAAARQRARPGRHRRHVDLQFGGVATPPQPRRRARRSPTSSATRRPCASPRSCGPTRCATTAGLHVLAAPIARERGRAHHRRSTSRRILTILLEAYDSVVIDAGSQPRRADDDRLRARRDRRPARLPGDRRR